jgi:hypothetical protein
MKKAIIVEAQSMKQTKSDGLQATFDLIVLRTPASGDMHGGGIAPRLHQISQDVLSG